MTFSICLAHTEDSLEESHLSNLYQLQDSSIRELKDEKFYLNTERLSVSQEGIVLHTDHLGLIPLQNLLKDNEGIYTIAFTHFYMCTHCHRRYANKPAKCTVCGRSDFRAVPVFVEPPGKR